MKTVYKLTDQNLQTHNGYQWKLCEWHEATGSGSDLCSDSFLHCYPSPLIAIVMNPVHADIRIPRLFKAEAEGDSEHDGQLKSGYKRMRIVEELTIPDISQNAKIRFAIYCALEVYKGKTFVEWTNNWLSGADRSARAAARAWAWAAEAAAEASIDLLHLLEKAIEDEHNYELTLEAK